ncbi:MAG: hypothetical protein ACJAY9_001219 [Flavobacteriales bacterium]|jgi:hypothetical protein
MLSLFKNKKININSITFPTFDWEVAKENENFKQWINKEHTVALSINFFDTKPDLPYLDEIDVVREFYRKELSANKGGLIEVNIKDINSYKMIKTLFKISQEPVGISYLASLSFPFKNYSFVIKIQSLEYGMTGVREAEITDSLLQNNELTLFEESYLEWARDPYRKNFNEGLLMNLSEKEIYDSIYPNHALSKARKIINTIENNLDFDSELENLKKLKK